nr:hypothetical protein [Tanacetum cinerariifolium]
KDDDVYTEATPLAQKFLVVDYQIIELNNKPYHKIIRADDTHQLYSCSDLKDSEKCTWSSKERKYPLTRFTLDQILNAVRFKVEEESEVSLKLLSLVLLSLNKTCLYTNRPTKSIIKDRVSDSEDEYETKAPQLVYSFVQSTEQAKSPRHSNQHVETSISAATPKPASPKPASNGKRRNRKACFLCKSVDHLIKDCDYHEKQMAQPITKNHAHRVLTQSKPLSITVVSLVSDVVPQIKVTQPKQVQPIVTKPKSPKLPISVSSGDLTCLFAKETIDESNLWHRRLGHINFKTMNKLVKGNLVRGLPTKVFENDHTCVACKKGKQHIAFCNTKPDSSVDQPLFRHHMDLFRHTFVKSLNKKSYCLVVTDDYSSSDNGTEFKSNDLNQFCGMKGTKREFSVPRTPQQNGIAEKKNRTLIEAARTMLADSLLTIPFWAEAVNTACYVQNMVLVTKPHNKTPYEFYKDYV